MDNNPLLLYRYPGTKPFEWNETNLFKGRDEDIKNLYELITFENMVVLYGRSGLGKTSLLNAGLTHRFADDATVDSLFIRFFNYFTDKPEKPIDKLYEAIAKKYGNDSGNFIYQKLIPAGQITAHKLWYLFKSAQIAGSGGKDTFILIFDQFEELFTYPEKDIARFKEELSELFFVKMPQQLRNVLKDKLALDKSLLTEEEITLLYSPLKIKILFAIRSDKLSLMNNLTDYFPAILKWCYELKPLNSQGAKDAIIKPALLDDKDYASHRFTFTEEALKLILNALLPDTNAASGKAISEQGIETFQLQIVCKYIENVVIEKGLTEITKEEAGDVKAIFENHYRDIIGKFPPEKQAPARRLIEDKLIIDGTRVSMPIPFIMKEIEGMTPELLNELVNTHIIRTEQNNTVEISHDTLIEPILKESTNEFTRLKQQGDVFYKQEKYEDAVNVFCQYIEATKKAPPADIMEVYKLRGDAYVKLKEYKKSNEDYEKIVKNNPTDISALYSIALNFFSLNDDDKADEYFVKAAELNLDYAANTYNEAGVTYYNIKLYDRAKLYFEKAVEKDANYFYAHYNLGLIYTDRNETETALQEFSTALALKPDSEDANNAMGNIYYKMQDYANAKKYYNVAAVINPNNFYTQYILGNIEVKNKNYDQALAYFQKAIDSNKNYEESYLQKAAVLTIKEKYDEGINCLNIAIEINPKSEEAYSQLGLVYLNKGDHENALKNLMLAVSIQPTAYTYYYLGLTYAGMEKADDAVASYIKTIELDPAYTTAYVQLGNLLLTLKRYDNVIAGFESMNPSIIEQTGAYGFLQQAYYFKQEDEKSKFYGLKILESNPDDYDASLYLALVEKFAGNYKNSLQYYQTLLRLAAKPAIIYNEMAKMATDEKDYPAAIEYAKAAIQTDASIAESYFNLGNVYYDLKDYENAKKNYETAVSIDNGYYYSFYNLALAEENVGNLEKAVEYYKRTIEINPQYPKAYLQLGVVLNALERYDESIGCLTALTQLLPSVEAWIALGDVYAIYKKDYEKAKQHYTTAIEADPQAEASYLKLGMAEFSLTNKEAALANYRKAINLNPQSYEAYYEIGNIALDNANYEEAVGYYETAVSFNPAFASAYNNLGHCYFFLEPLKKAELSFRKAADENIDNPYRYIAYVNLAEVQNRLGRYEEALASCNRSLELNPDYDMAYNNAGMAYEKLGQTANAVFHFKKALQLNPDNKESKEHLKQLAVPVTVEVSQVSVQVSPGFKLSGDS